MYLYSFSEERMTSFRPPELDSISTDSVASSPRSDHNFHPSPNLHTRFRFKCSFGGKILPWPHDNQLRYVGGETRIVAVHRSIPFSELLSKLSKLSGTIDMTVKYQFPNEDLDALISVTTDEDVENMMEEYERLTHNQNPRSARLRLFLFLKDEESRASSICSMLGGSAKRENCFFDALNRAASRLEHGRSEASSILSEALSSCCSRSSPPPVLLMPKLQPVKTRMADGHDPVVEPRDNQAQITGFLETNYQPTILQQTGYPGETVNYIPVPNYPIHSTNQVPVFSGSNSTGKYSGATNSTTITVRPSIPGDGETTPNEI